MKGQLHHFFSKSLRRLCLVVSIGYFTAITSCSKTEDPIPTVGKELPYNTPSKLRKMGGLLDSLNNATIYKSAWERADLRTYLDSLRGKDSTKPYSLFVPTDKAFESAGYSIDKIKSMPIADLNLLLRYLAIEGRIAYDTLLVPQGTTTFYSMTYPDPNLVSPGYQNYPYLYKINVGAFNNQLFINGKKVSSSANGLQGADGTMFLIDSLITKPVQTSYDVLSSDTTYSLYMAACRISDSIYNELFGGFGIPFDDTSFMLLNANTGIKGQDGWAVIFAPDNNAFRKAGFYNDEDLSDYIAQSTMLVTYWEDYMPKLTNMDSVLSNHRVLFNQRDMKTDKSYFYLADMLYNPYVRKWSNGVDFMNTGGLEGEITIGNINGKAVLHRQDFPMGRAAVVISSNDITTLTGVIHRVDNLLLPTP